MRIAHKILVRKDNIRMDLLDLGCDDVDWIQMAEDRIW
jgi:hypothetical protein